MKKSLLSRAIERTKSFFGAQEGQWRGPFTLFGEWGNGFQVNNVDEGWQRALRPEMAEKVAAVYACVMLNARAVSQCEARHLVANAKNQQEPSTTSPLSRILRYPNGYETFNQLIINTVADMLFRGEALWIAVRDDRGAVQDVHRIASGHWQIHVEPETRAIFYGIYEAGNELAPKTTAPNYLVPARDVAHFRQHVSPQHPLIGVSPVAHAAMAVGINVALSKSQMAFYHNYQRASGILSTDEPLTTEQKEQARKAFAKQAANWNQGGVPVLSHGTKYTPLTISSQDAQLIEAQRMSINEIANVYGVPIMMLTDNAGNSAGTEAMVNLWLSIGLGSVLETIERTIDKLFGLPQNERTNLDPAPLLRVDYEKRIAGLSKAVQNGILTPNESRNKEGYGDIEGGDDLFLQRQMTSISTLRALNEAELGEKLTPDPEPEPAPPEPEERQFNEIVAKAKVINLLDAKRKSA